MRGIPELFWLATQLLVVLVHRMERIHPTTRRSAGTRACLMEKSAGSWTPIKIRWPIFEILDSPLDLQVYGEILPLP